MNPEEMRDDIPADVREALAEAIRYIAEMPCHTRETDWLEDRIESAIRPKPRTVRLPAAELPAPLKELPGALAVWTVSHAAIAVTCLGSGSSDAKHAVEIGLAFATRSDAEAWLAHLQSWKRPGADWTPHVPGDPMPCDGEALVDIRFRDGDVSRSDHADHYSWQRLDEDRPHDFDITAWRYAREGEA